MQYLYFVWLSKRNQAAEREQAPFFETPTRTRLAVLAATALALGWVFFDGAPQFFDGWLAESHDPTSSSSLGPTPYFAAIYAFVNIHHYFMDTVIWRQRADPLPYEGRVGLTPGRIVPNARRCRTSSDCGFGYLPT